MRTPEKAEKDEIDKFLKSLGAYVVKPATYGFGASGHADRVCCIDGAFVSIEVKREGKTPTKLQMLRIDEVRKAGGFATWGTAAKVCAEIKVWLEKRGERKTLGL